MEKLITDRNYTVNVSNTKFSNLSFFLWNLYWIHLMKKSEIMKPTREKTYAPAACINWLNVDCVGMINGIISLIVFSSCN